VAAPRRRTAPEKVFARKADAIAHDSKIRADLARGELVDQSNRTTVSQWCHAWSESRAGGLRPNTIHGYTLFLHRLDAAPLGSRPLVKVRPSEVQAWAQSLAADGLAPGTLAKFTGLLRAAMRAAVTDGARASNPVPTGRELALPRPGREPFVALTKEQVDSWAAHAAPRFQAMIITHAATGLRIGELLGLRTADVDFLRGTVSVNAQLSPDGRERVALKTSRSRRTVPLPAHANAALAAHLARFGAGERGLIFTVSSGAVCRPRVAWKYYRDAAAAAGLPAHLGTHSLRHHYASVLLDRGESVFTVAAMCGNTPQMIMNVYGHLLDSPEDRVRAVMDAVWAQRGDAPGRKVFP
jgi:integrase